MKEEKNKSENDSRQILQQISGQLKLSLENVHSALERLAPPEKRDGDRAVDLSAAALCQSYYRIMRLANNIEDASAGEREPELRNDDVVEYFRQLVERAQGPAQLAGIDLSFSCAASSHIAAIDGGRMERLVLNLLSNAFKFTPSGGSVSVELEFVPGEMLLRVSDTGCGMTEEELATVFDRAQQRGRMEPPPHGLGLGLPICRRIAEEHGGRISLTSAPGQGTAVTVTLRDKKSRVIDLRAAVVDYAGGFSHTLVELSDVLPREAFTQKYLD